MEEPLFVDDQPPQEEGHEFNIAAIAIAQKVDKLYQGKVTGINHGLRLLPLALVRFPTYNGPL